MENKKIILILTGSVIIVSLIIIFFIFNYQVIKSSQKSVKPPILNLEELKKITVPEPQSQAESPNIVIPQQSIPSSPQSKSKLRTFEIKGEKGAIFPNELRAYQNDILDIVLTSLDQDYDFYLENYNVILNVKKGETKKVQFQASNIGQYNFFCYLCDSRNKPTG